MYYSTEYTGADYYTDGQVNKVNVENIITYKNWPVRCRHIWRPADNVEPVLAVVVDGLDVVEEDVGPVDPARHQVQGNTAGLGQADLLIQCEHFVDSMLWQQL